jgi:chromodomain-containing protein
LTRDHHLPNLEENQKEWIVEDIIGHHDTKGQRWYLVKWEGWPMEYNT